MAKWGSRDVKIFTFPREKINRTKDAAEKGLTQDISRHPGVYLFFGSVGQTFDDIS